MRKHKYLETTVIKEHSNSVTAFAVFANGDFASASYDKTICIWDAKTNKLKVKLRGHKDGVYALAALSNNSLASAGGDWFTALGDRRIRIWDIAEISKVETKELYDTREKNNFCLAATEILEHTGIIYSLKALSNNTLVSGSFDGTLRVWYANKSEDNMSIFGGYHSDLNSDDQAQKIHNRSIFSVEPLSTQCNEKILKSSSEIVTDSLVFVASADGSRWDRDGKFYIHIWNISDRGKNKPIKTLGYHYRSINSLAATEDGFLISGSNDKTVMMWHLDTGLGEKLLSHKDAILHVKILRNGNIVCIGADKSLIILDGKTKKILSKERKKYKIVTLDELPDGRLIFGTKDGMIVIEGNPIQEINTITTKNTGKSFDKVEASVISTPLNIEDLKEKFIQAIKQKNLKQVEQLKFNYCINAVWRDQHGNTALHIAAANGADDEILNLFKDNGINTSNSSVLSETPLYLAVKNGHPSVVAFLVNNGANIEKQYPMQNNKITVLEMALAILKPNAQELVDSLIKFVKDINQPVLGNQIPTLHVAARAGNIVVIRFLVKNKNADINTKDKDGKIPLIHAIESLQVDAVAILLELAGDCNYEQQENNFLERLAIVPIDDKTEHLRNQINNHLRNYFDAQRVKKSEREKLSHDLAAKIFLLFLSGLKDVTDNHGQKPSKLQGTINVLLQSSPALQKLKGAKSESQNQFIKFITNRIIKIQPNQVKRTIWYHDVKNSPDEKLQKNLKEPVDKALNDYSNMNMPNSIFIHMVIDLVEIYCDNCGMLFDDLKIWLRDAVTNDQRLTNLSLANCEPEKLSDFIKEELKYSLEDKKNSLNIPEEIWKQRINAAIGQWLYQNNHLDKKEKKAYELADKIVEGLRSLQKKGHGLLEKNKGLKNKKVGLARLLFQNIFEIYLNKDNSVIDRLSKHKLETFTENLIQSLKSNPMHHFSRSVDAQKQFSEKAKWAIDDWITKNSRYTHTPAYFTLIRDDEKANGEENKLKDFNKHQRFKDIFLKELDDLYAKFKSLDLGVVKRKKEFVDEIKDFVDQYKDKVPNFNIPYLPSIPSSAVSLVASGLANYFVHLKDTDVKKSAERITDLFGDKPDDRISNIKDAAELIAKRYEQQIKELTINGVDVFALCCAYRAVQYITDHNNNHIVDPPGFFKRHNITRKDLGNLFRGRKLLARVVELKAPIEMLVEGVELGKSERDGASILTERQARWTPLNIFKATGIVVIDQDGNKEYYTLDDEHVPKDEKHHAKYGYRLGTFKEAEEGHYKSEQECNRDENSKGCVIS